MHECKKQCVVAPGLRRDWCTHQIGARRHAFRGLALLFVCVVCSYGQTWRQLKPHVQYIPHGPSGSYDTNIVYAAMPMLNPGNASETWIYYDGVSHCRIALSQPP